VINRIKTYARALIHSYSEIVFLQGWLPGSMLLLCTFINPHVGLSGMICVLSAYLFIIFIGMDKTYLKTGYFTYNPLLVGLSIGFLFKINLLTASFTAAAGVLTLVLTSTVSNVFRKHLFLPVLSVPFVIVSSLAYLSTRGYAGLNMGELSERAYLWDQWLEVPLWFAGFSKSMGAIYFTPEVLAGLVFVVILALYSRILLFLALAGYFLGTSVTALMTGSFIQAYTDVYNFNFVLIALALGGVFLIPSLKSYIIAMIAVAISPFLMESAKVFWSEYGIPVFTLPFNVITLVFIYFLQLIEYPYLTRFFCLTPEKTLDHYLSTEMRFPGTFRGLSLPFFGSWTVWQGENGEWTHKGIWKHAVDFLIFDHSGKTHKNQGGRLEDYYCFKKPVLAPVSGRVIGVVKDVADNDPGETNRDSNWGNVVKLLDDRGFYVVLAHLAKDSSECFEGQWVEEGQVIGLCGNSGYSPQPHLHMHVQASPELGTATLPFSFLHYTVLNENNPCYLANHIPDKGQRLVPVKLDKRMKQRLSFLLDEELSFRVSINGSELEETVQVKMASDGNLYFQSGRGRLFFETRDGTFYLYRLEGRMSPGLKALFLALPRMPLAYEKGLGWQDYLPLEPAMNRMLRGTILFFSSFHHDFGKLRGEYCFVAQDEIRGKIFAPGNRFLFSTLVKLSPQKGFLCLEVTDTKHSPGPQHLGEN